jgi:hypothetical protein
VLSRMHDVQRPYMRTKSKGMHAAALRLLSLNFACVTPLHLVAAVPRRFLKGYAYCVIRMRDGFFEGC